MDIFFISFRESNCEENWKKLLEYHPNAKRLHGVTGINNAHIACEHLSTTEFFWTVDGDNQIIRKLIYEDRIDHDLIMFKAIDPLSDNLTLLGGVKIWRKGRIIEKSMKNGDFSLDATANKKVIDAVYSVTKYNDFPFDAWKTSFRHCVKLNSVLFKNRPGAKNIDIYLEQWKSYQHSKRKNSDWAHRGYLDALEYTSKNHNDIIELLKINDYNWLENYYENLYATFKRS